MQDAWNNVPPPTSAPWDDNAQWSTYQEPAYPPVQHHSQQQQHPQQQQQQWGAAPPNVMKWAAPQTSFFDPSQNPMIMQAGQDFATKHGQELFGKATSQYSSYFLWLKSSYFNVNNTFVVNKLLVLLFPFTKKEWNTRLENGGGGGDKDVNSPDLYIPLMGLSTYVLLVGLAKGTTHVFNPEMIVEVFVSSLLLQAFQVIFMKVGLYLAFGSRVVIPWFDLVAYSGYQFVGVALNMCIGVVLGASFYSICLLWTAACSGFVIFRTMQAATTIGVVHEDEDHHYVANSKFGKKFYFLIFCAVLQMGAMWFLGFTRELQSGVPPSPVLLTTTAIPLPTLIPSEVSATNVKQDGTPPVVKTKATAEEDAYEEEEPKPKRKAQSGKKKSAGGGGKRASAQQNGVQDV